MNKNLVSFGAVLLVVPTIALAHENDPKGKDMDPAYKGPGWLESQGGVAGGFNSSGMTLRSWLTVSELHNGSSGCSDCWGYVSPSGREYAIIGTSSGTTFVEITNPGNADVVQYIDGPNSTWRDIKVYDTYAYAVSEGGSGIQVMDLSGIDNGSVSLVNTVTAGGNQQTHNVVLDTESGFIYRVGGGSNYGLRIYDLNQSLVDPPLVGEMYDFYVHDAQVITYTEGPYAGLEVAFCCAGLNSGSTETALYVVNVTDKQNPALMRRVDYPNGSYSHQGWLSADRKYFLLQDELNNMSVTHVINVENPYQPFYVKDFDNGNSAITHNLYTTETFAFTANYTSGIRAFDARDPENMREVGYFDTYDANDNASFNGLWSCYPYFPSGNVIGSDIQRGLFVWTPDLSELILTPVGELPRNVPSNGAVIDFQVATLATSVDPDSAFVMFDDGSGMQQVSAAEIDTNVFRAVLPELLCPANLSISFGAMDVGGETFTSETYVTLVADLLDPVVNYDFESGGFTVEGDAQGAYDGRWMRGWPIEAVGAPSEDYDGSGRCYVTGNGTPLLDVDETTILLSPTLDATGGDAYLSYARWFSNTEGPWPGQDTLEIEISDNDGITWTTLESIGPGGPEADGGWYLVTFRIDEYVQPSSTVRWRCVASENETDSHVEAAIDRFMLEVVICGIMPADLDGDGAVAGSDLAILLGSWGICGDPDDCPADLDGDGWVAGSDLAQLLGAWTSGG